MRPFLQWREDWLLGCELLDEQHLEFADRMNQFYLFLTDIRKHLTNDPDGLKRRLSDLHGEAHRYFLAEEALMQACGFPGQAEHHREHVMLLAEMQECLREIKTNNRIFTLEDLKSLKYWQIDHALSSDREFADFFNSYSAPKQERASLSATA
jgi:hemerythrin